MTRFLGRKARIGPDTCVHYCITSSTETFVEHFAGCHCGGILSTRAYFGYDSHLGLAIAMRWRSRSGYYRLRQRSAIDRCSSRALLDVLSLRF